jgi:hypothetical protein
VLEWWIPGGRQAVEGGYGAADPYYPDPGYSVSVAGELPGRAVVSGPPSYAGPSASASASGFAGARVGGRVQQSGGGASWQGAHYGTAAQSSGTRQRALDALARRNPYAEDAAAAITDIFSPEDGAGPVAGAPAPAGSTFTGWPGAVPFRRDAWNFAEGWYILQRDDTFAGLAATYLGSPARWMEIWSLQSYRYTKAPDPSSVKPGRPLVQVGERVIMPAEATDRAKELVSTGAPSAPAIGGVGGTPKGKGAPWSTGTKVAIGAGLVGLVGLGAYAYST